MKVRHGPMALADIAHTEHGPGIGAQAGPTRISAIDMARGGAVLAMIVYHTAWDLSQLALIETDVTASRGWALFARTVAAWFLVLVGIGLVLAHGRGFRPGPFGRRIALLSAAALAVTVATALAFPQSFVFFGILHNIAVSSVLALPFLRLPAAVTALTAAAVIAVPSVASYPLFEAGPLVVLGLGTIPPNTNDYVPIFPWTGFVLAGVAAARAGPRLAHVARGSPGRLGRALATVGRHSLAVYLLHQPIIFGALLGFRALVGPNPAAEAAPFMASCGRSCRASGQEEALCRRSCACTADDLKAAGLWGAVLGGKPSADELSRATALARECLARTR